MPDIQEMSLFLFFWKFLLFPRDVLIKSKFHIENWFFSPVSYYCDGWQYYGIIYTCMQNLPFETFKVLRMSSLTETSLDSSYLRVSRPVSTSSSSATWSSVCSATSQPSAAPCRRWTRPAGNTTRYKILFILMGNTGTNGISSKQYIDIFLGTSITYIGETTEVTWYHPKWRLYALDLL